ncbi:MAG: Flp/Fap pilin component [Chloroflexota bacterium]|jgi:Flp pilus assembly pilin Flp|nr:Flp/Fap pilin component [Chloroflexota bacterium]
MLAMNPLASYAARLYLRLLEPEDEESGQGMVEYAFIISLVVVILIVVVVIIGNQARNLWVDIQNAFP